MRGASLPDGRQDLFMTQNKHCASLPLRLKADVEAANVAMRAGDEEASRLAIREHMLANCLVRRMLGLRLCVAVVNFHLSSCISAQSRWR